MRSRSSGKEGTTVLLEPSSERPVIDLDPKEFVARRRRRGSLGIACTSEPSGFHPIIDLSVTGALLETDGEIPVGRRLDLDLMLDSDTTVRVTARVIRVQQPRWGVIGGVGVAFTDFPGDSLATIGRFVHGPDAGARPSSTAGPSIRSDSPLPPGEPVS